MISKWLKRMRPIFQNVSMSAQWKKERHSEGTGVSPSRHFEGKGWSESSVGFYSGWIAECMMTSFLHRHHFIVITSYSWRKCCRVIANNLRDVSGGDRGATDAASGRRTQEIRLFCHQRRWGWGNCQYFFVICSHFSPNIPMHISITSLDCEEWLFSLPFLCESAQQLLWSSWIRQR